MEKYEGTLKVRWSAKENDFLIFYPRRCDGSYIQGRLFCSHLQFDYLKYCQNNSSPYNEIISIIDELEKRGYDKKTFKFEIKLHKCQE